MLLTKLFSLASSLSTIDCIISFPSFKKEDDAGQAYNDAVRKYGLEGVAVMNDTPQERARKNIQFDPLPPEMNHIRDLFKNLNLLDFGNLK